MDTWQIRTHTSFQQHAVNEIANFTVTVEHVIWPGLLQLFEVYVN